MKNITLLCCKDGLGYSKRCCQSSKECVNCRRMNRGFELIQGFVLQY